MLACLNRDNAIQAMPIVMYSIRLSGPQLSLVARYMLLSIVVTIFGLIALGVLYERFANTLLDRLTGERLNAQVTATASRLSSFLDNRFYQLSALSNHPAMPEFVRQDWYGAADADALLRLEADLPDLYGVLFFDQQDRLIRVVAGQAASGPPYWSGEDWSLDGLPVTQADNVEIIGPALPRDGRSGWLIARQRIRDAGQGGDASIALHLRLASLTELLGGAGVAGVIEPLLRVPGGVLLDATGRPAIASGRLIEGPEILPGWSIVLSVQPGALLEPLVTARIWLYVAAAAILGFILIAFFTLSRRLRHRIDTLLHGANSLAGGDLHYRLPEEQHNDEISRVAHAFNIMAERLNDLISRTVRAEKLAVLGGFATGVAHEVRNPLATMKTTVQALSRQERDPERHLLLTDMEREIDRLARVTTDLLAYGRPHPPSPKSTPVRELFRQMLSLLRPMAEDRDVALSSVGDSRLLVFADPDQALQILANLGLNALEACSAGGTISLRAVSQGAQVLISINDDGCGIPPEHLANVRTPFFTLKPSGTGLGLSICQQMAEANLVTMTIASEPGKGTCVSLLFPGPPKPSRK